MSLIVALSFQSNCSCFFILFVCTACQLRYVFLMDGLMVPGMSTMYHTSLVPVPKCPSGNHAESKIEPFRLAN